MYMGCFPPTIFLSREHTRGFLEYLSPKLLSILT